MKASTKKSAKNFLHGSTFYNFLTKLILMVSSIFKPFSQHFPPSIPQSLQHQFLSLFSLMADHSPSHTTTDLYRILGIPFKDICKGFMKLNPSVHKSPRNKANQGGEDANFISIKQPDKSHGKTEPYEISTPTTPLSHHQSVDERFFANMTRAFSRSNSRRSKTPTPSPRSSSRNKSRRSTTPNQNRRNSSDSEYLNEQITRNFSGRTNESPISLSRETSRKYSSEASALLSRNTSKRSPGATPIIYSQSTALKKPPPVEKKLECTLEELLEGCVKKIMITRDAIVNGIIVEEEEMLKIEVKPGWKKRTKITFEGKGDEKPGYLPADIIFSIDERRHPLFSRDGDDLEIGVEIPLLNALTGCSVPVPLLGGEKMSLSFDNIIYPGFQKVIRGQGMPTQQQGIRGDLRIQFLVDFPSELSPEQRAEAASILQDCS